MQVLVVGAGVGGLTAAICLRRFGFDVEVFDRRPAPVAAAAGQVVMSNALVALDRIGLDLNLPKHGVELSSHEIRTARGKLIRALPYAELSQALGQPTVLISRADLLEALLNAAVGIPVHHNRTVTGFEHARLRFTDGTTAQGDVLVGADGYRSAIRRQLAGYEPVVDSGHLCWLALVPFDLPPGSTRHYWGDGQRFGLTDVGRGRAYWWGTKKTTETGWRKAEIEKAFAGWADEVVRVIDATDEDAIITVPSRDRPFLEQWGEGLVTLLGEAAHPMLAGLGQRSGLAIEDAVVLATALAAAPDAETGLRHYEDLRRERTRAMVTASRAATEHAGHHLLHELYFRFAPKSVLAREVRRLLTFPPG